MTARQIAIGTFSRITQLSLKALRLYDERGLLIPAERDLCTGYRYYTYNQLERGVLIRKLTWLGFSLQEVGAILDAKEQGDRATVASFFTRRLEATEREMAVLHAIQKVLQTQDPLTGGFGMSVTEPVIKEIPDLRVLSIRERGVYSETIPRLIGTLFSRVAPCGGEELPTRMAGPIMFICHDEEYQETDADIEVAIPITGKAVIEDPGIEVRNMSGGRFVSVVYTGPYPDVGEAYQKIFSWLADKGLAPAGPTRELYLNDPNEVPESGLMTEVQCPVAGE
jgi:effector-binding domain-containing protein/DNA-binding transcriptional MerR regulator